MGGSVFGARRWLSIACSFSSLGTPGGTFTYAYDAAGRPTALTNPFSENFGWTWRNNGWLQTQTLANGVVSTYTQNAAGQLTALENRTGLGALLSSFTGLAYDGAGNMTGVTAAVPAHPQFAGLTSWQYDTKDQLTLEQSARSGGYTHGFGYDPAGNPTTFKGATRSFNANNQDTGNTYDGNGNPTLYGGTAVTWDAENRLTSYGAVLTAGYRADGLRAWKQTAAGRTYFLYDGITPLVELNAAGAVTAVNTFGANGLLSRRAVGSSTFYTFDQRGSLVQRTDAAGGVLSSHMYDAYGVPQNSGANPDPFGFEAQAGYFTDAETGLCALAFRYYDPAGGRFLNRDPISHSGGVNLYAYVQNSPTASRDPLGLCGDKNTGIPRAPYYIGMDDIVHNLKAARGFNPVPSNDFWLVGHAVALEKFNQHVRRGGPWDYKQADHMYRGLAKINTMIAPSLPSGDSWAMAQGAGVTQNRYEDFGNWHYGATAYAVGLSKRTAQRMAGWAQIQAHPGAPHRGDPGGGKYEILLGLGKGQPPYGDDPRDSNMISAGYDWAKKYFR